MTNRWAAHVWNLPARAAKTYMPILPSAIPSIRLFVRTIRIYALTLVLIASARRLLAHCAGLCALALLLNACASIPTNSIINSAEIKQEHIKQNIRYLPAGPKSFKTQEETVEGFVLAGVGVFDNFAVAREFIAPEEQNNWNPLAKVYITQGELSYSQRSPNQENIISASTLVVGTLDSLGTLEFFQPKNITQDFTLKSFEGTWKLQSPPDAIFLPQQVFFDLFAKHTVYFYDSIFAHFVPDIRWRIPAPNEPYSAVADLFTGPSAWIKNAATTAVPKSLHFMHANKTDDTHIQIHTQGTLNVDSAQLALLFAQLEKTVRSTHFGANIELYVNDNHIPQPSKHFFESVPVDFAAFSPLASLPSGLATAELSKIIIDQNFSAVHDFMTSIKANKGSFSTKYKQFVFLTPRGIYKTDFEAKHSTLLRHGSKILEPRIDAFGNIWVWDSAGKNSGLFYYPPNSKNPIRVNIPHTITGQVRAFAFSPDSARIAIITTDSQKALLHILSVAQGPNRAAIAGDISLPLSGTDAHDVDWLDPVTISVLTSDSHGGRSIANYTIGEYLPESSSVPDAVQIVGGGYLTNAKVTTSDGSVFTPKGKKWRAEPYSANFFLRQAPTQ